MTISISELTGAPVTGTLSVVVGGIGVVSGTKKLRWVSTKKHDFQTYALKNIMAQHNMKQQRMSN